jgi:hypothetical protein
LPILPISGDNTEQQMTHGAIIGGREKTFNELISNKYTTTFFSCFRDTN